jgi:chemotaxis protein MotB
MEQELEQRRRDVPAPSAIETAGRSDAASEPTPPPAAIENGMLTQVRAQLAEALEPESEKGLAQVQQEADRVRITMPERLLFPQGQARLRAEGTAALKRVGAVLKQASDAVIVVEGHTDSVPVGQRMRAQFASNWEFSAARAAAVVRYFLEESGLRSEYVSAAGYADARPIDSNETPAGRAANRRLEILVLSKSSTVLASHHP